MVVVAVFCLCALLAVSCGSTDTPAAETMPVATSTTSTSTTTAGAAGFAEAAPLYPIKVEGRWGFIDGTGAVKIEPRFQDIRRLDGEGGLIGFCEGLCAVQLVENGLWGFIDTSGRLVIEPQFDLAQWFSEGLAVVRNADDWWFVDQTGTMVLGPFRGAFSFRHGLASVCNADGGVSRIDASGRHVPDLEGPGGSRLSISTGYAEGLAVAYAHGGSDGVASLAGYADRSGVLVIEPRFNVATEFSEGLAAAGIGANDDVMEYGYIDATGAWIVQPRFWMADPFSEGLARVAVKTKAGVKVGFIDQTGAWAIEPRFDDTHSFSEGLAIAWEGDECGYIDKTGAVAIPLQYQIAGFDFSEGVALVGYGYDGSPSYIDKTGKMIWQGE